MADTYKVSIKNPLSFPAEQRVRSGVLVTKQDGYEGELTDEQLQAVQADDYLSVEKVTASKPADDSKSSSKPAKK